jgi:predicted nicotinamide N-methyase
MTLPYPSVISSIPIGEKMVKIASVKDPHKLFDDLLGKGKDHPDFIEEKIPYWGELWPSSIGLSDFLCRNVPLVQGKSVLEIGCGLGLPGIVAALLGAKATLTDYLTEPLLYAQYNWNLNLSTQADIRMLDWQKPEEFIHADVILASDIAYEGRSFQPIKKALKNLAGKNGTIIISEPNREFAKTFFQDFTSDFHVRKEIYFVDMNGFRNKISIYVLNLL